MLETLGIVNYGLLLLFGVFLSLHFAGVEQSGSTWLQTLLLAVFCIAAQLVSWILLGLDATFKLYPLIVHLPLTLYLMFVCKRPPLLSLVSVFTAYLCCQFSNWFGTLALYLFDSKFAYYAANALLLIPLYVVLRRFAAPALYQLMSLSRRSLLFFGIVPIGYYLFDYAATVYTEALYSGARVVVEFMPSMVCLCYVAFAVLYCGELRRRGDSEQEKRLLSLQLKASRQHMDELKLAQEQARYYRHDIRHHLALISAYLAAGETEQLREYLLDVQKDVAAITPVRYCENETVNLILSSFSGKAKARGVRLDVDAALPSALPIGDTELCTLLSNALENALPAAGAVEDGREKAVRMECRAQAGKLLLLVENPYAGEVRLENGLPVARRAGHGFGVKSMASIVERHGGLCSFSAENGVFTLRIVL
ncbi:sensor histidine kinase [Oscillibacter ruminantium]|uniref:sensor histidine kinase n=1 Tax=Oscillibacter ruminantium TaxID=1263547 RepID=UPI003329BB88